MPTTITVPYSISYACQFASPDLVREFVNRQRDLLTDPCWADYGASTPAEYAHWAMRSCGVVCVKMVVEGMMDLPPRTVMDWVNEGLSIDGYLTEIRRDRPVEVGWKHVALADLARAYGCSADLVSGISLDDIANHIRHNRTLILSVTSELGEDAPITRKNGHLIVVYGVVLGDTGSVETLIAHNPSGRRSEMQAGAHIGAARFLEGFSGRGIVVGPKGVTRE
jgi:hypothetical protein